MRTVDFVTRLRRPFFAIHSTSASVNCPKMKSTLRIEPPIEPWGRVPRSIAFRRRPSVPDRVARGEGVTVLEAAARTVLAPARDPTLDAGAVERGARLEDASGGRSVGGARRALARQ